MSWRDRIAIRLLAVSVVIGLATFSFGQSPPYPRRIVSLAPSITETVFALGFGTRLVGVTTYCDYPSEARKLPKVGGFVSPSLEVIASMRPDLVLGVSGATDPVKAKEMERFGFKVRLLSLASLSNILSSIRSIARLLGSAEAGEGLAKNILRQFDNVKSRIAGAPRRTILLAVGIRPLVAVGGKNYLNELITLAGGQNIAANASQPWLNLPDEYVVAKAPQVIIEAGMGSERGDSTKHWDDLKSIPAVREHRVYAYPSDKILRPGPRIGEGLEEIARLIHAECFVPAKHGEQQGSGCESSRP
jgi:cobalamin transport system substrate-binding protein